MKNQTSLPVDPEKLRGIKVRGIKIDVSGVDLNKVPDICFLDMPDFLVEHDADGPFLGVQTEKAHYKIRLEE